MQSTTTARLARFSDSVSTTATYEIGLPGSYRNLDEVRARVRETVEGSLQIASALRESHQALNELLGREDPASFPAYLWALEISDEAAGGQWRLIDSGVVELQ